MSLYLDYNSSSPIDDRVVDAMIDIYRNVIGNADSRTHEYGENARKNVENARKQVATLLGVKADEVFFTSGATESCNIAILGLKEYAEKTGKKHIITSAIEHKAVLETVKALENQGFEIDVIYPDLSGRISVEEIKSKLKNDTLLVSIMHVNNETGIIQPVKEIGEFLKEKKILFHVDATQSFGKLVKELQQLKYNMLSFSAHKFHGPQGIGGLILKKEAYKLPPIKNIMYGGQQEHGIRPGTIPVALAVGCGKACEIAEKEYILNEEKNDILKKKVISLLNDSMVEYKINGDQKFCMNHVVNICFPGVKSEALMILTKQYCGISNGSACTSKNYSPSYVLKAMGMSLEDIECSVRISWGANTSVEELENNLSELLKMAKNIKI